MTKIFPTTWLACALLLAGCPDDSKGDAKNDAKDGGGNHAEDAAAGNTDPTDSGSNTEADAAQAGDAAPGADDAAVAGGTIEGPNLFHVSIANATGSNVHTDDFDSDKGTAQQSGDDPLNTTFSASSMGTPVMRTFTLALVGPVTVGATYEMTEVTYTATSAGTGYLQMLESGVEGSSPYFHMWRAGSGKVTVVAVSGTAVKVTATGLEMIGAVTNAPNNTATGTFDLDLEVQALMVMKL